MLEQARRRDCLLPNVRWHLATAESYEPAGTYSLVVAAESLHWMDWEEVLHGFSRERMSRDAARAFDLAVRALVLAHEPTGSVTGTIVTTVNWGLPHGA